MSAVCTPCPDLAADPSGYLSWLSDQIQVLTGLDLTDFTSAVEAGELDADDEGVSEAAALLAEHYC